MTWHPKSRKIKPNYYRVECGEEAVEVRNVLTESGRKWVAWPKGKPPHLHSQRFDTKEAAVEWASEWLKEYA